METKNWRDVVTLTKVGLDWPEEPDAHYYEAIRKHDDLTLAYLDLADNKQSWLVDVCGVDGLKANLWTAEDTLALAESVQYLNSLIALEELTHVSQDMGLYEAM